ncbi:cytochrome P450 2K6-like isoform X3 [Eleutherodactylus coqui]|uniref:cytochrome P450 2K6-like isoform X3 n=1 Tax=Eleutherodactylus coqui TaxID=57060 RepID=UPI00346234C2
MIWSSASIRGFAEDMFPLDQVTVLLSIVICIFLALVLYKQKENVHPNYPPGPKPLPIIGNILNLNVQKPHLSFLELAKKYGPVFSIKLGTEKMVVLCGYDTVKEALVNRAEEFLDRPMTPAFMDLTGGYGEPFDNTMAIHAAVANIIVSITLGRRFDYDDPKLQRTIDIINNNVRIVGSPMAMLYNAFPSVMRWIPGSHQSIRKNTNELHSFIREIFMKQRDQLDINDQRSLIDCFLVKQKQEKPNPERYFHDENLTSLVRDLFIGGMETTGSTLRWSLLLMMKYPEIQKTVQKEIEKVIGLAEPQMAHRQQMPYTDAVIHEIQRFTDIVPNNLPRSTTQDVILKGCFLPKGTYIIPSLTSVLRDAKYFKKPDEFYPQHFLDADGNFVKIQAFIPFSVGKRSCAGANLAKMELFLFFTKLLQNFTFKVPPGAKLDLNAAVGYVSAPHKHEICAIFRNNE